MELFPNASAFATMRHASRLRCAMRAMRAACLCATERRSYPLDLVHAGVTSSVALASQCGVTQGAMLDRHQNGGHLAKETNRTDKGLLRDSGSAVAAARHLQDVWWRPCESLRRIAGISAHSTTKYGGTVSLSKQKTYSQARPQ